MPLGSTPSSGRHWLVVPANALCPRLVCPVITQYEPSREAVTTFAPLMTDSRFPVPISFCPAFSTRGLEIRYTPGERQKVVLSGLDATFAWISTPGASSTP